MIDFLISINMLSKHDNFLNLMDQNQTEDYVVIKKYANRRLYDTSQSNYINLNDLADMILAGINFIVYDAKTGDDITRTILTQIIADKESKGFSILPISFLKDMIKLYGDNVSGLVPHYWPNYLQESMQFFKQNHEKLRQGFDKALEGMYFQFNQMSRVADTHSQVVSQTFDMFNPFISSEKTQNKHNEPHEQITITRKDYEALIFEINRLRQMTNNADCDDSLSLKEKDNSSKD